MKARVRWLDGMLHLGETGSGHAVAMDGPPDLGGRNLGPRPMEMLLLGLGACASVDIVHILRKGRQPVIGCEVELEAERAESEPKVFTQIDLHFIVSGETGLSERAVARAVELSAEKYCSASIMLAHSVVLKHRYSVRRPSCE